MKKKYPPVLDAAEQIRLANAGVIDEANAVRRMIRHAASSTTSHAIVALAMRLHPGLPAGAAIQTLKNEIAEVLSRLTASSEAMLAERKRLDPVVAQAAHRGFEIAAAVEHIDGIIRSGESSSDGKRDRLRKAGLTGVELDRAAAPFDSSDLLAKRAALIAEREALGEFIRSRDTHHLPHGFELSEAA